MLCACSGIGVRYQIKFFVNILPIHCNNGIINQIGIDDITREVRTKNVLKISTRQRKLDCTEMSHLDEDIAYSPS